MNFITALFSLAFLAFTTFFSDGGSRYYEVSSQVGTAPLTVIFNSEALIESKNAHTFIWDFGNGETLTTTNAITNFTYNNAGTFTAKLRYLKNKQDKIDKAKDGGTVIIVVAQKPNELPVPQLACQSNVVSNLECNASGSLDNDGTIVSYKYDWGDSTFTESLNANIVNHQYQSAGEKVVRLTVTDDKGASAFIEKSYSLKSNTAPVASFNCSKSGIQKIHCESSSSDNEEVLSIFKWTLDDGTIYNTSSFDHTYNRPEDVAIVNHNIELTVTDSLGLTDSSSQSISVDLQPLLQAPRGYFKVFMDGTKVNLHAFIARTQFNIKRAYYTIYGASTTPLKTIELNEFYANTISKIDLQNFGGYRIFMTVVDMRDQVFQTSVPFTLSEDTFQLQPHVEFRAFQSAPNNVSINLNPSFAFDESAVIRSFTIDFGDGVQQELTNDTLVSHQYAEAGTYNISVTAKTSHNTQKTLTRAFTVTANDVGIIYPDPTFNYIIYDYAQNVSFYNEKSWTPNGAIISYLWDFGDGTSGVGETQAHFYAPGTYIVSLTVTDTAGLTNTQIQKITISAAGPDIVANIDCFLQGPFVDLPQRCKVTALDRLNEISRVRVVWGDGTAFNLINLADINQGTYFPTKKYSEAGTYPVRLIVNTVRGETKIHDITHTLTVRKPVAALDCFVLDRNVDCNSGGSFDPKNTKLSYKFQFSDGYSLENDSGIISHTFENDGEYSISLVVTDETGLSDTKSMVLNVYARRPIASIQCQTNNLLVFCDALGSYDPKGTQLIYELDFGNGHVETSSTGIITYAYPDAGLYDVSVKVTDQTGLSSLAFTKIQAVKPPNQFPIANFNCESPEPMTLICWDDGSIDPDGTISIRKLTFDDNTFSYLNPPEYVRHQFAASGTRSVTLTVIDNDGSVINLTKEFELNTNSNPIANFDCYIGDAQRLNCWSQAFDPDEGDMFTMLEWSVQYQGIEELKTQGIQNYGFDKIFNHAGEVEVTLKVSDKFGGSGELKKSFTLKENQAPIADVNCFILTGSTYQCNSNAYDPDGQIISQVFKVNGELAGTTNVLNYDFINGGDYVVTFEATDSFGKVGISSFTISVDKPIAQFVCIENSPLIINCSPHSEMDMTSILLVKYTFDGFDEVKANTASHVFSHFGEHKIEVTVYTEDGKIAVQQILMNFIKRHLNPKAAFNTQVDVGFLAKLNGSESLLQEREIASYAWDFGDGKSIVSAVSEVEHSYDSEGTYNISLTVTDKLGMTNTISKAVYIFDSEVQNPGQLGLSTVKGVDSDNDNVRDDVQRWIASEAKDNVRLKIVLKRLAQNYQLNILNYTNIEYSQSLIIQKAQLESCLKGILTDDLTYEHLTSMMNYIHYYTEHRIYIRSKIFMNMSGLDLPSIPMSIEGQIQQCTSLGI